jgi:hypothetical protein
MVVPPPGNADPAPWQIKADGSRELPNPSTAAAPAVKAKKKKDK